jgi:phage terminase small subunit
MPAEVASNDLMRECWEWTVGGASHFTDADVPMLTLLVHWWAVARQCSANLAAESGGVVTQVDTPMGPRQDPDIRTLQLATNQVRQLSSELGVGPLARTRMGLMKIATASMAADLPAKVFKMLDEHYGD